MALFRGEENVKALDGREMPLMKVISETLRYIADKAIEKLKDQLGEEIVKKEKDIYEQNQYFQFTKKSTKEAI